ncbi:MAG: hypothetical protein NVSMB18_00230 [Acetobacteraceae bacterium]
MTIWRRQLLWFPLGLAACADEPPPRRDFPPLRYDFLVPLRLNVARIDLAPPPPPGALDALNPAPPAEALQRMAQDRLAPGGSTGRAAFVIDEARIAQVPGGLTGTLAVHLDVFTTEGTKAGFAEAGVTRQTTGGRDLRGALYDITRQMLDDMNVEFEFQVRRSLRDWLQEATTAPPPAPVERQDLTRPAL